MSARARLPPRASRGSRTRRGCGVSPLPSGPASSRHAALLAGGHGARGHGTRGQRLCHSGREKPCDVHLKARHSLHARGGTTRPPALPTAARSPTKATKTRKTRGTKWSVGRTLACNVEPGGRASPRSALPGNTSRLGVCCSAHLTAKARE